MWNLEQGQRRINRTKELGREDKLTVAKGEGRGRWGK